MLRGNIFYYEGSLSKFDIYVWWGYQIFFKQLLEFEIFLALSCEYGI